MFNDIYVLFFPFFPFILTAIIQELLSPSGPRIPAGKAHPTAMPLDMEPDEEHKAMKAFPKSSGEHTHTKTQGTTDACTKASRHIQNHPDMYSTQYKHTHMH